MEDLVNHPSHYAGNIETIDYIRDKLEPSGFTDYCIGNVMKYISRWRKKDGKQDLKKAQVYLQWAIESAEKEPFIRDPADLRQLLDPYIPLNAEAGDDLR